MKIVETVSGSITSTKQFFCGEERDGSGNVSKQFFSLGQISGGTSYFFRKDHLGSVRAMTDSSGTVQASYYFDPYGRSSKLDGALESDFGFAGMYVHARSGLNLTAYRAYNASLGRWLSRDPIGQAGGSNLYSYTSNGPVGAVDPTGLDPITDTAQQLVRQRNIPVPLRNCVVGRLKHSLGALLVSYPNQPHVGVVAGVGVEVGELIRAASGILVGSVVNVFTGNRSMLDWSVGSLNELSSPDLPKDLDSDITGASYSHLPLETAVNILIFDAVKKCANSNPSISACQKPWGRQVAWRGASPFDSGTATAWGWHMMFHQVDVGRDGDISDMNLSAPDPNNGIPWVIN